MERYHFHVAVGENETRDHAGQEHPHIHSVRQAAAEKMCATVSHHPHEKWGEDDWHVTVCDAQGLMLFRMITTVIESPISRR